MRLLVPLFIGIIFCSTGNGMEAELYEYHLSEVSHAVSGVIGIDTARGERVRAILETLITEEHEGEGEPEHKYLQLTYIRNPRHLASKTTQNFDVIMTTEKPLASSNHHETVRKSKTGTTMPKPTAIHLEQTTEDMNMDSSSDPNDVTGWHSNPITSTLLSHHLRNVHITHHSRSGHHVNVHKRDAPNPHVVYNIAETSAFYVDPLDKYIKVNDTLEFQDHASVEFYVYLTNNVGEVISNPLPFTVHIERPVEDDSYPLGPAVFAGVLVLVIVFLALFIPFVTRAKRRYRQGKPVFKLGSHPSSVDLDSKASMSRASSEPNWYGNNAYYNYEDEVARERNDFSSGIKQYTNTTPTVQLPKTSKETLSVNSGSSGIDIASQYAEGTIADETTSQRILINSLDPDETLSFSASRLDSSCL